MKKGRASRGIAGLAVLIVGLGLLFFSAGRTTNALAPYSAFHLCFLFPNDFSFCQGTSNAAGVVVTKTVVPNPANTQDTNPNNDTQFTRGQWVTYFIEMHNTSGHSVSANPELVDTYPDPLVYVENVDNSNPALNPLPTKLPQPGYALAYFTSQPQLSQNDQPGNTNIDQLCGKTNSVCYSSAPDSHTVTIDNLPAIASGASLWLRISFQIGEVTTP